MEPWTTLARADACRLGSIGVYFTLQAFCIPGTTLMNFLAGALFGAFAKPRVLTAVLLQYCTGTLSKSVRRLFAAEPARMPPPAPPVASRAMLACLHAV